MLHPMDPRKTYLPVDQISSSSSMLSMTPPAVIMSTQKSSNITASSVRSKTGLVCVNTEESATTPKPQVKKPKSSFRLPGTKKRRKEKRATNEVDKTSPSVPVGHQPTAWVVDPTLKSPSTKSPYSFLDVKKDPAREPVASKEQHKSHRKSKRNNKSSTGKNHSKRAPAPELPVFGVPLEVAVQRDPSFDGVPLPAFFRHCIDYLEKYGLSFEGIYRVPGVNSQIQALVAALNRGESFTRIAPTSAEYYQHHQQQQREGPRARPSFPGLQAAFEHKAPSKPKGFTSSPLKLRLTGEKKPGTSIGFSMSTLPHDLSVIASVVKQFLRNLPEPVMTTTLRPVVEALPPEVPQVYHDLAQIVHQQLPRSNRFLLAWLLQHMMHIIDRAGENLMTLANISIVLSPPLQISHRLLAILLSPPPHGLRIDLTQLDPSLPPVDLTEVGVDPSAWHWLFPHPVYLLRPYRPPLTPGPDVELPETDAELDEELRKQESLLQHLHEQIGRGETSDEREALLWEVQRLVTELRRRKSLSDPEVIRAELSRQQAQLDRLHEAIASEQARPAVDSQLWTSVSLHQFAQRSAAASESTGNKKREHHQSSKSGKRRSSGTSSYSDELWEVQRQVTMLKRRLKQKEKTAAHSQTVPTTTTTATTLTPDVTKTSSTVVMSGAIPLVIPSVAELDQEEVLNLTLRKLTADAPVNATSTDTDDSSILMQASKPDTTLERAPSTRLPAVDVESLPRSPSESPQAIQIVPPRCDLQTGPSDTAAIEPVQTEAAENVPELPTVPSSSANELDEQEITVAESTTIQPTKAQLEMEQNEHDSSAVDTPIALDSEPLPETVPPVQSSWCTFDSEAKTQAQHPAAPLERQGSQQLAFYSVRKQELQAINADLRARIWSENAEISRLQSCISNLLETGGKRVKRIYETQLNTRPRSKSTQTDGPEQSLATWLDYSWTRMAERLCTEDYDPNEKEASCLMDEQDGSDVSSSASEDEEEIEAGSEDSQPVAYSRLAEDLDEEEPLFEASNLDETEPYHHSSSAVQTDGDDEDDEEDEGELELARTLHQLTLDNARLEQLNCRYLDGIQAERNRCAELKVLLKLRNTLTQTYADPSE